jgi:hypothetical protein
MKELKSIKYGKIIPVKLIDNKLVRIKEAPCLESKNLKTLLDNSASFSTEPSNRIISTRSTRNGLEKFTVELNKKYQNILEDVKNEIEMVGTVEENVGEYPNLDPFGPNSKMHTQSHISNSKKVFFKKKDEEAVVFKVLDSKLYLTIYNKAPPQKKFFRRSELNQIIKIQNKFKGIYLREVERGVDRMKAENCILETMLLLIGKAYDNARKKITFKALKKEFHDPFNNINDELKFEDKIQFKLPNRYYNISDINQIDSARHSPTKKKARFKLIY